MIRHYDMTTGEVVAEEIQDGPTQSVQLIAETVSPRLMTVQENAALLARDTHLPADIATLPVQTILAKWS
ncbi:MAG: hypothetical protein KJN79_07920 [Gammaproteobacteria bacterium]|nr:hypothetical protein [Gammaproteobacteria bacterium]